MFLYEFSIITERFILVLQLIMVMVFIGVFLYVGWKVLKGNFRYVVLAPIFYALIISYGLYSKFDDLNQYQYKLEHNLVDVVSGQLQSIVYDKRSDVFIDDSSPRMVEELVIDNKNITRFSPKVYSRGRGCLSRYLKEDLQDFIGMEVKISYIKYEVDNIRYFIPCILKVEVLQ